MILVCGWIVDMFFIDKLNAQNILCKNVYIFTYPKFQNVFTIFQNSSSSENVRIVCWQLLGSLCKQHFYIIQENMELLDKIFFTNLNSSNSDEQLHVVMTLNKFLEQIIGKCKYFVLHIKNFK